MNVLPTCCPARPWQKGQSPDMEEVGPRRSRKVDVADRMASFTQDMSHTRAPPAATLTRLVA